MSLRIFSFFLFPAFVIDLFLTCTVVSEPNSTNVCSFPFNCSNSIPILFPFSSLNSSCGVNLISCNGNFTKIRLFNSDFTVKRITYGDRNIEVRYPDSYEAKLCSPPQNFSFSGKLVARNFRLSGPSLTFFKCNSANDGLLHPRLPWKRKDCGDGSLLYYFYSPQEQKQLPLGGERINCPIYEIPAGVEESASANLSAILSGGFSLHWRFDCQKCNTSGGQCVFGEDDALACYCNDGSLHDRDCSDGSTSKLAGTDVRKKWIVGLAAAVGGLLVACLLFLITRSHWVSSSRRSPTENGCLQIHTPTKVEKFLIDYEIHTTTRYTYNDIKKMTHKFKHKLGQGGYGSVYKGWLSNGIPVAVKLIEKSYNDGEEFCNEVATIGRIHHVNVVRLLGFCVEGSRRALVYEFMANGSLDKFTSATIAGQYCLPRERLYDTALGIARGIEYLHQGCDRRIIHFDIKPHNILLDHDFTPKVSDFGLAKSYGKERNSVTITEGKGTIGYIAPELFYGNSKHASHKSDVYSFGMLLIAMVGMKEKIGPADGSSIEAYFPQWIHDALSKNQKFEGIGEGQDEIIRKIATIALWCIQWNPIDRPCMKEVIMMFEGSTSNLTMPPNHFCPLTPPEYMVQAVDSSSTSEYSLL